MVWAVSPWHPPLPCPLRALTGVPCPFCGLTRAVTALFRGDLVGSLRYNPFGLVLVVMAVVAVVLLRRRHATFAVPTWIVAGFVASMWAWNLTLNPTFH